MKIFGLEIRTISSKKEQPKEERGTGYLSSFLGGANYSTYASYTSEKSMTLSGCYRAVNLISDGIASLQMKVYDIDNEGYKTDSYDDTLYNILGFEPNDTMSRFDFFKLIVTAILLRGNAYVRIKRNGSFDVESLEFINPDLVTIGVVNDQMKYNVLGVQGVIDSSDMIHIRNFAQMGNVYGISTIDYAINTLEIAYNSETHASSFYKNGANAAVLLGTGGNFGQKAEQDLKTRLANTPNGVVPISGVPDLTVTKIGIDPQKAQLLETRNFNITEIGRFFSVNPILLFDNTKATYSNIEQAQLDFFITTLTPMIEKIENEFNRKLILPSKRRNKEIRFDEESILRLDSASRATYYKSLFEMGVVTSNQIAQKNNLPKVKGDSGDKYFITTNAQDANNLIVNQDNSLDNKLK